MPKVGDWVSFKILPPWVEKLPKESQAVFKFCVGRTYLVSEIDEYGHFVLDVSPDVDKQFGGFMNDIRVEEKYIEVVNIGKPSAK